MAADITVSELWYPDASITSPRARDIIARVNRLSCYLDVRGAIDFIESLQTEDLADVSILLRAVSCYHGLGQYKRAADLLTATQADVLLQRSDAIYHEGLAALSLLSASVASSSMGTIKEAVALAREVEEVYNKRQLEPEAEGITEATKLAMKRIIEQRPFWNPPDPAPWVTLSPLMTGTRIDLEYLILHIKRMGVDAGYLKAAPTSEELASRFLPLLGYLRSSGQHMREAMLVADLLSWLPPAVALSESLDESITTLVQPELAVLRALIRLRLSMTTKSSDLQRAQQFADEALEVFEQEQCAGWVAVVGFFRWRDLQKPPSDALEDFIPGPPRRTDTSGSTSGMDGSLVKRWTASDEYASKRFDDLLLLHETFYRLEHTTDQREVLRNAINMVETHAFLRPRLERALELTLRQLRRLGDEWKVVVLQFWHYLPMSQSLEYAETAKVFFETTLSSTGRVLTPDVYRTACMGAWRSHNTLHNPKAAFKFARMELDSEYAKLHLNIESEAVSRLVNSERDMALDELATMSPVDSQGRARIRHVLETKLSLLDEWVLRDQQAGRLSNLRSKQFTQSLLLGDLCTKLDATIWKKRWEEHVLTEAQKRTLDPQSKDTVTRIAPILVLTNLGKYQEAIDYSDQIYNAALHDPSMSPSMVSALATAAAVALARVGQIRPPVPDDVRRRLLSKQYSYCMTDLPIAKLAHPGLYLMRAILISSTISDCLKVWPEKSEGYLKTMSDYLENSRELCRDVRRGIQSDAPLTQWVRRRAVASQMSFATLCQTAVGFYLTHGMYPEAWKWMQQSRAQALQDMLSDRDTAASRMLLALDNSLDVNEQLAKEQMLVTAMEQAGPQNYFEARQNLEAHRRQMREIPALRNLLLGPESNTALDLDHLDAFWELKQYLPEKQGIVLVDFFTDVRKTLWRLDFSYERRHNSNSIRWTRGYMTPQRLERWKKKYLKFSAIDCQLRDRWRALHDLRPLLHGLETLCEPGDLVILSPNSALAGIPIHGIPVGDATGKILIERNPVIYSGGLSLMRQCLDRAKKVTWQGSDPLLQRAAFASAFEEAGFEKEREAVYASLKAEAAKFGSKLLLGERLTTTAMEEELRGGRWLHYHGHAYYAKTEALNQCLVLGRLSKQEQAVQTRVGPIAPDIADIQARLGAELPYEAPMSEEEAVLANHLLEGCSRLTVADIFAMDLSATHPVVINIACDSGVQDFSAGEDPLGLTAALFCAGASTVLGTLWPTLSSMGRVFTAAFYDSLAAQDKRSVSELRNGPKQFVDLALAYQAATLTVRKVRPDPFAWAPFVLQGSPIHFYGSGSGNKLNDVYEQMHDLSLDHDKK